MQRIWICRGYGYAEEIEMQRRWGWRCSEMEMQKRWGWRCIGDRDGEAGENGD